MKSESEAAQLWWTVAYQAPPSMGFSRQEYWSGLPLPSPGDLPNPGTEPGSPALQADSLPFEPWFNGSKASLVAQRIKRPPAMQETQVQSLGWEDPLEKAMATHSSILAWKIPWQPTPVFLPGKSHGGRSLAGYSLWGCRVGHD